jgi:hypothetical protein
MQGALASVYGELRRAELWMEDYFELAARNTNVFAEFKAVRN